MMDEDDDITLTETIILVESIAASFGFVAWVVLGYTGLYRATVMLALLAIVDMKRVEHGLA